MQTLDHSPAPTTPTVSFMPRALQYGLIWGGTSIVISLVATLTDTDPNMPDTAGIIKLLYGGVGFIIAIGAISMAIKTHRDSDLGGAISFGRGLGVAVMTSLIAGAVAALFNLLYVTVIDPEYIATLLDATEAQMETRGLSDEDMETSLGVVKMFINPGVMFLSAVIGTLFIGTIIGLIASAVFKRDPK